MTAYRIERITLIALALFGAISAIGGGIAILVGSIEFPLEWLTGTPFRSYTIPGLVLTFIVGGSHLLAGVALIRRDDWGVPAAAMTGLIMIVWIIVEIALVGSEPGIMRQLQTICMIIGLFELGLAALLWKAPKHTTDASKQEVA